MKRSLNFWRWDESLNHSAYKLGGELAPFIDQGMVVQNKYDPFLYEVIHGIPDRVRASSGQITSFFFEKRFLEFTEHENLWEMKKFDFIEVINGYLEPCDHNYMGDILKVMFIDIFVGYAKILRKTDN
ncbi:hypothetical protein L0P88_08870 [Muricauda sp. SCSIO 64092]|uniref:hypothetical protein n=1 Tax=Allomuricauda sp. SCSIO 64092 TaxID=2908842 RepID=UPI001FF46722|nr:hypothetical protein [Muricauda sp. SCSIO 64092]UOY08651.1 hypothetical protein L0P88_08870 [Muricauda sp. SCSIO 64092]